MKYQAVVIGINGYSNGITALQTAKRDAQDIGRLLATEHGYEVIELLDGAADLFAIEELVKYQMPSLVDDETALVFYFAGHGVALDAEDSTPQGYILPVDAGREPDSWLAMKVLHESLDALECHHLLVILDCCFAGSFRWTSTRNITAVGRRLYDAQLERFIKFRTRQLLTSAAHDEKAMDAFLRAGKVGIEENSPFAAGLIEALKGAADSESSGFESDGIITATEIFQYLQRSLFDAEVPQTPGLAPWPGSKGEFVFYAPDRKRATRKDPELLEEDNPWLSLKPYGSEDAERFFGRDAEIESLVARVADPEKGSLIVVIGPSGVGKSSLVRAGVVPELRMPQRIQGATPWRVEVVECLDRCAPQESIDAAVETLVRAGADRGDDPGGRLLVIDQFEQVFNRCDAKSRVPFFKRLCQLIDRGEIRILIVARSDFEPQLRARIAFGFRLIGAALAPVAPPGIEGLRRIIEGPAEQKALQFDPPELVGRIIEEVHTMPGALPMLSFALFNIYLASVLRRRKEGPDFALTEADYRAIGVDDANVDDPSVGGVAGALHRQASKLHDDATPEKQAMIRWVFLRMVASEGGLARRRVSLRELEHRNQQLVDEVLEDYADAGLLTCGDDYVEPAHDALIIAWPRFRQWLESAGPQDLWRGLWRSAVGWRDHQGSRRDRRGLLWTEDPRLSLVADTDGWLQVWHRLRSAVIRERRARAQEERRNSRRQMNALEHRFIRKAVGELRRRRILRRSLTALVFMMLAAFSLFSWRQLQKVADLNRRGCLTFTYLVEAGHLAKVAGAAARRSFRAATSQVLLKEGRQTTAGLVALEIDLSQTEDATSLRAIHDVLSAEEGHFLGRAEPADLDDVEWQKSQHQQAVPASRREPHTEGKEEGDRKAEAKEEEALSLPPIDDAMPPQAASIPPDIDLLPIIEALRLPDGLQLPADFDETTVTAIDYAPDGIRILGVFSDQIRVWDRQTGLQIFGLHSPVEITAVAWSRLGDRIYTRTADGTGMWAAGADLVQGLVRAQSLECLSRRQRKRLLREGEQEALAGFEKCDQCKSRFFDELDSSRDHASAMRKFNECRRVGVAQVAPFAEILRCPK